MVRRLLMFLFCLVFVALAQDKVKINLSGLKYPLLARDLNIQGDVHFVITGSQSKSGWELVEGHPLLVQATEEHMKTWWYKDLKTRTRVFYAFRIIPNGARDKEGWCLNRSGLSDKAEVSARYSAGSEIKKGRVADKPAVHIIVRIIGSCADTMQTASSTQ